MENLPIPAEVVTLLVGHFTQSLTIEQEEMLDKWLLESEDNRKIFEDFLNRVSPLVANSSDMQTDNS